MCKYLAEPREGGHGTQFCPNSRNVPASDNNVLGQPPCSLDHSTINVREILKRVLTT